jgi:hypothetical protein
MALCAVMWVTDSGEGRDVPPHLLIGHVLPTGTTVESVTLDGAAVAYDVRSTARGQEVVADAGTGTGPSTLVVTLAG